MFGNKVRERGWKRVRTLLKPKVLIPTIVGAIALAALLSLSDVRKVWHIIEGYNVVLIPALFALFVVREFLRTVVWRYFLRAIGIKASNPQAALTLTGGDAAQVLPAGIYVQDLLVSQDLETKVSEPLAVTTLMIWMELSLSMITLAIVGLPAVPWFRWIMVVCGIGSLVIMLVGRTKLLHWVEGRVRGWQERLGDRADNWKGRIGQKLVDGLGTFIETFEPLSQPKVLATGLAITGVYMFVTMYAFYLVNLGLGISQIGLGPSAAIYALILMITNGNPLPTDLGVSELSGIGGFLAFGVNRETGLAAMLTFRMASVLFEELIAAVVFLTFRDEVKKILRRIRSSMRANESENGEEKAEQGPADEGEKAEASAASDGKQEERSGDHPAQRQREPQGAADKRGPEPEVPRKEPEIAGQSQ
jgi:uncharacterized protein (TIRG00374 family)